MKHRLTTTVYEMDPDSKKLFPTFIWSNFKVQLISIIMVEQYYGILHIHMSSVNITTYL